MKQSLQSIYGQHCAKHFFEKLYLAISQNHLICVCIWWNLPRLICVTRTFITDKFIKIRIVEFVEIWSQTASKLFRDASGELRQGNNLQETDKSNAVKRRNQEHHLANWADLWNAYPKEGLAPIRVVPDWKRVLSKKDKNDEGRLGSTRFNRI